MNNFNPKAVVIENDCYLKLNLGFKVSNADKWFINHLSIEESAQFITFLCECNKLEKEGYTRFMEDVYLANPNIAMVGEMLEWADTLYTVYSGYETLKVGTVNGTRVKILKFVDKDEGEDYATSVVIEKDGVEVTLSEEDLAKGGFSQIKTFEGRTPFYYLDVEKASDYLESLL